MTLNSWDDLEKTVKGCTMCDLHRYRKNVVIGEGPRDAEIMFVGEAPGATEDEMGRPFVGAAGKLLTMAMESVGIRRSSVYITNVVKCRPPNNREPNEDEIKMCITYLETQIMLIKPKIIVTLGNIAGKTIFGLANEQWHGVTKMRGKKYSLKILGNETAIIPTIHPAAALYNPQLRNILIEDLKTVKNTSEKILEKETKETKTLINYIKKKQQ